MNFLKSSHRFFIVMIVIKGLEWAFQLVVWTLAFIVSQEFLSRIVGWYLRGELVENQHDTVASFFLSQLSGMSLSTQHFIGLYFLSHGIIKFFIVYNILKKRYWAYPFAIIIFSFFTLYQVYLYIESWSLWMIGLIIVDIVVAVLTYIEYQSVKKTHIS